MAEHVVKFKAPAIAGNPLSGQELHVDLAAGYIYDADGNQVGRGSPTSQAKTQMVADYVGEMDVRMRASAVGSAIAFNPQKAEERREVAKLAYRDGMTRLLSERFKNSPKAPDPDVRKLDIGIADVHQPQALPNYAAGYANEGFVADVIAPPILTPYPSDLFYTFAKEDAFQRAMPTVGAPAANAMEVAPRVANTTFKTIERALGGFLPTQVENAADPALKLRQAYAQRVYMALMLERELRCATLFTTSGSFDASVVATILAGSQWDGGANSDPVKDSQNRMEAAWTQMLSGAVMNEQILHAFQRNPAVQKFIAYKDGIAPMPKASELSAILELPPFYVARAKYITSTGALGYVWPSTNVPFFKMPSTFPPVDQRDISTGATFRWNDTKVPDGRVSNGFCMREFFVQARGTKGGFMQIMIHQDAEVVTSAFAAGLLVNAYQ